MREECTVTGDCGSRGWQ